MTMTGECVRQRVIGFSAVSENGRNTHLLGTNCTYCDDTYDPMRRDGKPCVDAYWHAFHSVSSWVGLGHNARVEPVYADVDPAVDADRDPADRLVDAINTHVQQRADREMADLDSWTDHRSGIRYVAVLRGVRAVRTGEREITVTVPNTPDGRMWGYVAAEVIDGPCEDVDPVVFDYRTGRIDAVIDRQKYTYTW